MSRCVHLKGMSHPNHDEYSGTLDIMLLLYQAPSTLPSPTRTTLMCQDHERHSHSRKLFDPQDEPPDWQNIRLPEPAVLRLRECPLSQFAEELHTDPSLLALPVVDAHCHPTDMSFTEDQVKKVGLGGLSAMATRIHDQELVEAFGQEYGSREASTSDDPTTMKAVSCFGETTGIIGADSKANMAARLPSLVLPPAQRQQRRYAD